MRTNRLFWMAGALCAALGLGSCSNEMEDVAVPAEGATRTVTLTVTLPGGGADTRTAYEANDEGGLKVTWAKGDKLTAFSDDTWNFTKSTPFTLVSGEGTDTATFEGELPEDVPAEGGEVDFLYPAVTPIEIDGVTHYISPDYRTQGGTLAGLSKQDDLVFRAKYSGGKLNDISDSGHWTIFLHFAAGTAVASAGGTATFTISGAGAGLVWSAEEYIREDIRVSNVTVNPEGTLVDDLYIAFVEIPGSTPTLTITVGSEEKVYGFDKEFELGTMYNISDLSVLTKKSTATNS